MRTVMPSVFSASYFSARHSLRSNTRQDRAGRSAERHPCGRCSARRAGRQNRTRQYAARAIAAESAPDRGRSVRSAPSGHPLLNRCARLTDAKPRRKRNARIDVRYVKRDLVDRGRRSVLSAQNGGESEEKRDDCAEVWNAAVEAFCRHRYLSNSTELT
jgi:hypothetical protein